jgi:two-component system, NarL family, sensor kinase
MTDPFPGLRSTGLRQVIRVDEVEHDVLHVTGRPGGTTAARASPSVRREVAKFVAASLVAVIVFVVASLPFLRRLGRTEAIRDARATARLAAAGVVEPNLDDALLERAPRSLARLDRVVQERVLSESIVRVKIWSPDGRIVYSDEPRLIGARFPLADDEREALVTGDAHAELSNLSDPENRFERPEGELLEVYSRVRTPNGTPVLFEIYQRYDSVIAGGRRIWLSFLPALLAALLLLWLVQVPLAYRLARRVRQGHAEREVLSRRALDASNDERRRIAADLHDGVVQDLAGISYSLAAAAETTPAAREDPKLRATLREGASVTRASMQRLRSLLLSIHPPNVRAAGLKAALTDLVSPLERRGIRVELDTAQPLDLEPETEALVFRAAREAIRNVVEHADAEHVTVRVQPANGSLLLTVNDDGVGFDPERRAERRSEGHVGLSLLEEIAAHAEARIEIRSQPGRGTSFSLEVPV